jgi:hypothetical protein
MKNLLDVNDLTIGSNKQKVSLIKELHKLKVDFRTMNQFKALLIEIVQNGNRITDEEFHRVKKLLIKDISGFAAIEEALL